MRSLRRTLSAAGKTERTLLAIFGLLIVVSAFMLLQQFYRENTERIPRRGGTYIEGSVGSIRMLNPWFTVTNDVNRDITSLVFSGLQRYNPYSGEIEDDLAEIKVTGNDRYYTATLKEDIFWHDSTEEDPRPVTADDVVFTYQTIQKQGFPNPILQKNFRGVEIEKIDDRTVQFRLEQPYAFFRSNLTLGILPRHHLEDVPPNRLLEALDFNLSPIGCGPYRFKSIVEAPLSTEVTLEKNDQFYGAKPYIDRIIFRAFPDYSSLLSDLRNLHGVRHVPRDKDGHAVIPKRYTTFAYTLPQYVALFFNLDTKILDDQNLRLALQLATNKNDIVKEINESVIVDTPLLEFAEEDWQYQFEPHAAEGALFDSDWHLPEKVRLQHLLENRDRNATGALVFPQQTILLAEGGSITTTGSYIPDLDPNLYVNGLPVQKVENAENQWTVTLPTEGTGSVAIGENFLRLTLTGSKILDTFVLTRAADPDEFERLREEQKIVDMFLEGRKEENGEEEDEDEKKKESVAIADILLIDGALKLRKENEPYGVRINEHGEALRLMLLTSPLPPSYPKVAELVAKQWRAIGVDVSVVVPDDKREFEDRVIRREYDVLLFGQPLLENLDSYPYWHSSQIQIFEEPSESDELSEEEIEEEGPEAKGLRLDANNLSQFTNFKADALLEQIRGTRNEQVRKQTLDLLREVFREEVPAIVLYSPTYVFAMSKDVLGVELGRPSLHSDRFLSMHRWFIKQKRTFKTGTSWMSFFPWILSLSGKN